MLRSGKARAPSCRWTAALHAVSLLVAELSFLVCSVSTVYRGVCSATLRPVIIKCYIKAKMKPKNFTRMEREIRLMKFLSQSEMMCQFFGSFESDNHKYIIMEHCRGGDLLKFMLMRGGNLPEPWVASQVCLELSSALPVQLTCYVCTDRMIDLCLA